MGGAVAAIMLPRAGWEPVARPCPNQATARAGLPGVGAELLAGLRSWGRRSEVTFKTAALTLNKTRHIEAGSAFKRGGG